MNRLNIRCVTLATALLFATAAPAQAPIDVAGGAPQASVSYADLDLRNPAGVAALRDRVRAAAARLCLSYRGGDLEERMARQTCFHTAIESARGQVEQAVADFGRTRFAGQSTITVAVR